MKEFILSIMILIAMVFSIGFTDDNIITVKAYSRHFTVGELSEYITENGDSILLKDATAECYNVTIDTTTSTILSKTECNF